MGILDEKAAAASISVITIPHPTHSLKQSPSVDVLSTIDDAESTSSLSPATTLSPDGKTGVSPFSPFYNPSPTRLSLDAQKSESRRGTAAGAIAPINTTITYDTDLEAGNTPPTSACSLVKSPMKARADAAAAENFYCTVWPTPRAMRLKRKAMRREKARYMLCGCTARLSEPARTWVKVAMAVVLAGAAVGIAIGISKAVGGGWWRSNEATNAPLGHGPSR